VDYPFRYRFVTRVVFLLFVLTAINCSDNGTASASNDEVEKLPVDTAAAPQNQPEAELKPADVATILARKEVPILCYHQIREYKASDSKTARDYIVPPARFAEQMKILADSGYHTILPDQLYDYLLYGKQLPAKPVMLTFDDTDLEQYTEALPVMEKYDFKAVFFIMTVSINRPRYMTREQIKDLSDRGNVIASHTWNHSNVKKYSGDDWKIQIEKPSALLEEITGKPIRYFAYPFGLWNEEAIPELKKREFLAAFQLSTKRSPGEPLYTIRRIIVPGSWTASGMYKAMMNSFH